MTAVGPFGVILTGTLAVGASGSSWAAGAAGCCALEGGVDCWASANDSATANGIAAKAVTKSDALIFIPNLRVNHRPRSVPAPCQEAIGVA